MRQVVAFIHAKAESKRLPGKHFADIDGTPLIEHVMNDVLLAATVDDVVVSSDDEGILKCGEEFGYSIDVRPPEWCDESLHTGYEVYQRSAALYRKAHPAVDELIVVGIEGNTIRFDTGEGGIIDRCVHALVSHPTAARCAAVTRCDHDHPDFAREFDSDGHLRPWGLKFGIPHNSRSFKAAFREACLPVWRDRIREGPAIAVEIEPWSFCHVHTQFDLDRAKWLYAYTQQINTPTLVDARA